MNRLMSRFECYHIKHRSIIESNWETFKNNFQLEYHKARSIVGMFRHFFYSIAAYMINPKSGLLSKLFQITFNLENSNFGLIKVDRHKGTSAPDRIHQVRFKRKKPASPAPHAPATVLFPGSAVPAKAGGIVTPCPRKMNLK